MEKPYRPEPISTQERLLDYWLFHLYEEQRRTNELLETLISLEMKPKTTRKKKGDEE